MREVRHLIKSTVRLCALLCVCVTTSGCNQALDPSSNSPDGPTGGNGQPLPTGPNPFDALYPSGFHLPALAADPIVVLGRPANKAMGLTAPTYIDAAYKTRVYKATTASDYTGTMVRHEYSRRQAFNADNSRYLAQSSNGFWLLYDAATFTRLSRNGTSGALKGLAGDCEPIWHPTDPTKLFYTSTNGGLVWYEKNVETDTDAVMFDFTGKLPWPGATSVWTKAEGTSSADGRYFALMATSYNASTQANVIYGLLTFDRVEKKIVGTLDAAMFNNQFPDHISISASGKYAVPSWAFAPTLGTRAYPLDFSSSVQLHEESEHSDLALGPNGEDYYVVTDYKTGQVRAINIENRQSFDLLTLYPRGGTSYAAHLSGKAFARPGWVVMSTYADYTDYGQRAPDPTLEAMYRKVILLELKPNGRKYSVAHVHAAGNAGEYFGEHQATVSVDGSRILFASNFDDGGAPESYMVGLPSSVYE